MFLVKNLPLLSSWTRRKFKPDIMGHYRAATHLIPTLPVPEFLSPWTNDPHKIDPPGQTVPIKFGPHGQMVPKNSVSMDKCFLTNLVPIDQWSPWRSFVQGDRKWGTGSPGTKWVRDQMHRCPRKADFIFSKVGFL